MASEFPHSNPIPPPAAGGGMTGRIKRLFTEPKLEWLRIDAEPASASSVFRNWAVPLAAIGPVCGLIGMQVFGIGAFGYRYKPSLASSLVTAVLGYAMALVGTWIITLVIEALAPTFNAVKSRDQAMKVAAYSYTAAWVAGVFQIIPALSLIGALIGLFSFYLLWIGLPMLMKPPADKAAGYTIATIVATIVVYVVVGIIVTTVSGAMIASTVGYGASAATLGSVSGPNGASVDLGKLDAAAKQMAAAANGAAAAGAPGGGGALKIADPAALQALLPSSVAGFTRTAVESSGGAAGGIGGATAKGTYTQGDQSFDLSVTDAGAMGALASLGGALNINSSKQTATGYEKTQTVNGQMVNEEWDTSNHNGKYGTMVASRFMVEAEGTAPSIDPLKAAVGAIDQGGLAALAK